MPMGYDVKLMRRKLNSSVWREDGKVTKTEGRSQRQEGW